MQAAHPVTLLRTLLSMFSSSLDTGERGMHLQTFDLTLKDSYCSPHHADTVVHSGTPAPAIIAGTCGCLEALHRAAQITWLRGNCPSQSGIALHSPSGSHDAEWPFIRPHPVMGDPVWLPGLSPYGTFTYYFYEVRTLIALSSLLRDAQFA